MKKILIAGLQHAHIKTLYDKINSTPDCEIVGVYDELYDENFGIKVTHRNFREMLDNCEADILAVGDAYGKRGQIIIGGLKKGLHIIADKPLCTSLAELDEIEKLAKEKKAVIGCMLDLRENTNIYGAKKYIGEGLLGKVKSLQFSGQHPLNYGVRPMWYFEKDMHGGTINDIAIHALDICEFMLDCEIDRFNFAESWNTFAEVPHFQDGSRVAFTMANGCRCMGEVSYFAPDVSGFSTPFYWRFTIWGEKGVIEFNYNDDGITFAVSKEPGLKKLAGYANEWTDLSSFLAEISGEMPPLNTAHILKISRKCLELQKQSFK
ncbi:MAG: Gfo/Idh/MocA family oxidoreductase [Lentisphaeria bacterium]|nr:Gfo/Idh/MocA family oxidoreductase [Lentisphaeria bacterium]